LHEEVKLLFASGLTSTQALTTATINGPKFFGLSKFYGSLQPGKCSDLIILDGDPIKKLDAIDHINTVVANGKVYTRSDLNALLNSIKH
jgi:imidazolonepropionase-like amidohydrolase